MYTRILVLLAFLPGLLPAQSDFLQDPDIVWAAEIEQDWMVDIPSLEDEYLEGINTIKLLRTRQNEAHWTTPFLPSLVFDAVLAGKFPVFTDPKCLIPGDIQQITHYKDTLIIFDEETYEEIVKIVDASIIPSTDVKGWRLRQILAYHKKSALWSTTVEAIAPLLADKVSKAGDTLLLHPLFWFRPENKRPKLDSKGIVWAKETKNRQAGTLVSSDPKQMVKVTDGYQNPLVHLLDVLKNDMKTPFYSAGIDRPLTPSERRSLMVRSDTVVTFDPETYEEKVTVVNNDFNPYTIHQLRLNQTWYWDERRSRLSICLDAVAPIKDVMDELGVFRYSMPLFYRKSRR